MEPSVATIRYTVAAKKNASLNFANISLTEDQKLDMGKTKSTPSL